MNLSKACIAVTVSALAGNAAAGVKIHLESKNIDSSYAQAILDVLLSDNMLSDVKADYSVFGDAIFIDGEPATVNNKLIQLAATTEQVDTDSTGIFSGGGTAYNLNCYDNCHSNCHGSRSWR